MDPTAALHRLLDALAEGRYAAATADFADLLGWLDSGGFPPADPTKGTAGQYQPLVNAFTEGDAPEAIREFDDLTFDALAGRHE
jgi:hypothetical protein